MPIERMPSKPLPTTYVPPGGAPYRVKDGDDWKSVAIANVLDANSLIYFNFLTNNPDEVNWYLRRNTGCNKPTPDGKNWTFSSSARPGIIYLYPRTITFDPKPIDVSPGRKNRLSIILDDHKEEFELAMSETALFILDIYEIAHAALEVGNLTALTTGSKALEPLSEDFGLLLPIAFAVKFWTELGKANVEPLLALKKHMFLMGLSEGIVLGANGAAPGYVMSNYWQRRPITNYPVHADHGRELQQYYNLGIKTGYEYGKQLNRPEKAVLFKDLMSRMDPPYEQQFPSEPWGSWNNATKKKYYDQCAMLFRIFHLPKD